MLAMWVKVRVKPSERERFLKAIEVDALGSERDEPGCMRFNVLQDTQDQHIYYSTKSTATRRHWRRIGRRPTTPCGAQPQTPWTARPRRRAARLYFLLPRGIGSKKGSAPG
jgi:hypothetical protein